MHRSNSHRSNSHSPSLHRKSADPNQNIFLAVTVGLITLAVIVALLGGIISQIVSVKPFRHRIELFLRRSLLCINTKDPKQLKQSIKEKKTVLIRNLCHIAVSTYHELTLFTQGLIVTDNLMDCIEYYNSRPKKPLYISILPLADISITVTSQTKLQTQNLQSGDLFMGPLHPELNYRVETTTDTIVVFWYDKPFPDDTQYDIRGEPTEWLHPKKSLKQLKIHIIK